MEGNRSEYTYLRIRVVWNIYICAFHIHVGKIVSICMWCLKEPSLHSTTHKVYEPLVPVYKNGSTHLEGFLVWLGSVVSLWITKLFFQ